MNEDRVVAAILAAGIVSASQKAVTASRAVTVFDDVFAVLTASGAAPVIEQRDPAQPSASEPRVTWLPRHGNT